MIRSRKLGYGLYGILRKVVIAAGLIGPARRLAGPIAGRLLFRLSFGDGGLAQVHGHRMHLASAGGYPPVDMAMDRYEPRTTQLLEEVVKPGMVIIDIGAHVGYYTLLAARQVGPTGRVYAFEPNQENHSLLLKNIEVNGYANVVATKMAVSDRVGSSPLYLTALDSGRHSLYRHGLPERGVATIETTTLDTFLESVDWPKVDLIKIDVEGAEVAVLDGMAKVIERSANLKLIIEFNPTLLRNAGVAPLEFLERLASSGRRAYRIDDAAGLLPLEPGDAAPFVDRILASESSVNLFCTRE